MNGDRNGGNSSGGSSGSGSSSSRSRSRSNNSGDDGRASGIVGGGGGKPYDTDHRGKDKFLYSSPDGGAGRGAAVSDGKSFAVSGGDAEEEGEVLLMGSVASSAVPTAGVRSPSSRVHRRDRANGYSGAGGRSGKDDDGEGYNASRRANSIPRDRRGGVGEREGSGDEGVGVGGGVVERPKIAGKDRWADSDSEDEDDDEGSKVG